MFTEFSIYLDFLIALVFTLAVGSMILSALFELFAFYMKLRSRFLKNVINDVLNDNELNYNYTARFYEHPQIDLTKKTYRHLPAYISSLNFAQVLINTVVQTHEAEEEKFVHDKGRVSLQKGSDQDKIVERFKDAVAKMNFSDLKILLTGFISTAENNKEDLTKNISLWYDEYMNRASGWYKTKVQRVMIIMAVIGCFAFNIDLFRISKVLIHDPALSSHIADLAERYSTENEESVRETISGLDSLSDKQIQDEIKARQAELDKYLNLLDEMYKQNAPVGWQSESIPKLSDDHSGSFWFWKFGGCMLAALALALGAPFWFDLLSKLVNLRKAGLKPAALSPPEK